MEDQDLDNLQKQAEEDKRKDMKQREIVSKKGKAAKKPKYGEEKLLGLGEGMYG